MTDLSETQRLAESATQVLESEVFQRSRDAVNSLIIQAWIKTPPEAVEERERLYAQFHYGQNYASTLLNAIDSYRSAQAKEEHQADK